MTLLEMVQSILNDMDSDAVNSITDTQEAIQVASIIRDCYWKLIARRDDWPFLRTLTTLTGLNDTNNPTKMQVPTTLSKVEWVKYNKKNVTWMEPEDFKDMIDTRTEAVGVVDANGYIINADPLYYTSYDEEYLIFDGYDSATENYLTASNSTVYGITIPTWTHSNSFYPTLPTKMFPGFLADAKGSCFLNLKQQAQAKEEAYAQRSVSRFQRTSYRNRTAQPSTNQGVNFGRK